MMILITLVLLAIQLTNLFKGKMFYDDIVGVGEYEIAKKEGTVTSEMEEKVKKSMLKYMVFGVLLIITLFAYLISAVNVDPYKIPTVVVLAFIVLGSVFNTRKKNKLDTPDDIRKYKAKLYKRHSFTGKLTNLMYIAYYSYMFYVLVFMV